jgi:hypothetical protein
MNEQGGLRVGEAHANFFQKNLLVLRDETQFGQFDGKKMFRRIVGNHRRDAAQSALVGEDVADAGVGLLADADAEPAYRRV